MGSNSHRLVANLILGAGKHGKRVLPYIGTEGVSPSAGQPVGLEWRLDTQLWDDGTVKGRVSEASALREGLQQRAIPVTAVPSACPLRAKVAGLAHLLPAMAVETF